MDDQRDYEEEQAQEAALREEQEAELERVEFNLADAAASEGLETLGDTAPVDSSSEDYVGPEVAATVDAEAGEEEQGSLTLAQIAEVEGLSFARINDEIAALCNFGARTAEQMKAVYDHGLDPEPDKATVELTALESQALSVGLNLVTLFEPRLAEYAESLLRRATKVVSEVEMSEERRGEIRRHLTEIQEEQEASLFGFESVEEYREARAQAEADLLDKQAAATQPEPGAPHLN